jgi:hypothetical protein
MEFDTAVAVINRPNVRWARPFPGSFPGAGSAARGTAAQCVVQFDRLDGGYAREYTSKRQPCIPFAFHLHSI